MRIVAFIEEKVIDEILKHLGISDTKAKPSPVPKASLVTTHFDYSDSQRSSPDYFYADPGYPMDSYVSSYAHRHIYQTFHPVMLTFQSDLKATIRESGKERTKRTHFSRGFYLKTIPAPSLPSSH